MKEQNTVKPLILALETATPVSSVALFRGPDLIGSNEYFSSRTHAKLITTMVQTLLSDLELSTKDLSAIAVAKGPGSYTGLRVGVSTAKGLSMALDRPLLSVGSLAGLAWQVQAFAQNMDALICPMIDARRMEVYCEIFDANVQSQSPAEAKIIDENSYAEILRDRKLIFIGNGAEKCQDTLGGHPNSIFLPEIKSSARSMGSVIWEKFSAEQFENLTTFEPFYLKDFVATPNKKPLF